MELSLIELSLILKLFPVSATKITLHGTIVVHAAVAVGHVMLGKLLEHLMLPLLTQSEAGIRVDHFRVHHLN